MIFLKSIHFSFSVWKKMQMYDQRKFHSNFILHNKMEHGGIIWWQLQSWLLANYTGWQMVASFCNDQNCHKQYPHTSLNTWQFDMLMESRNSCSSSVTNQGFKKLRVFCVKHSQIQREMKVILGQGKWWRKNDLLKVSTWRARRKSCDDGGMMAEYS